MATQSNQPAPITNGTRSVTTRRALLGAELALTPVVLVGALGGRAALRAKLTARGGGALVNQAFPSCVVTPELTEGPYFVEEGLLRSDIRSDPSSGALSEGAPLRLTFQISDVTGGVCAPLSGAMVDVWQCDALGVYSDVVDQMGAGFSSKGQRFLRGAQTTDAAGQAEFLTIFPGWYRGRAVHTHFKVRTDPAAPGCHQFISQLFFDDALTDLVHSRPPYSTKGPHDTRNGRDGVFQGGGDQMLLAIAEEGAGYAATIAIGVDLSAPSSPSGAVGPGGRPPGPPPQRP